jgi:hypothetical protein
MTAPRNNAAKTRGRPFQAGNPGKPVGARHRATLAAEGLLAGQVEALTQKAVQAALQGDMAAMRLCLERVAPVRKGATIRIELPYVIDINTLNNALNSVIQGVAIGELTTDEGAAVAGLLEAKRRVIETQELEARIKALEGKQHEPAD